jgi:hypothetical protein
MANLRLGPLISLIVLFVFVVLFEGAWRVAACALQKLGFEVKS